MINSFPWLKRLSSIGGSWCFAFHISAMASGGWELISDDDPWRMSAFISAIMELFLSILLLLGAAVAFITSQFVKFFGLDPPCTYIGCSHPLHSESTRGQRYSVPPLYQSKEPYVDDLCPDCHNPQTYSKLQRKAFSFTDGSCDNEDECHISGRDDSSSRDPNATESDVDFCGHHHLDSSRRYNHEGHHVWCDHRNSTLYRRLNRHEYVKRKSFVAAAAADRSFDDDNLPLFSARSVSEISSNSDAEDHCEMSSISAKFCLQREKYVQKGICIDDDASTHSGEALRRETDDENPHMRLGYMDEEISEVPSLPFGSMQAKNAQLSSQCVVDEQFDVPKVSTCNPHQLANNGANLAFLNDQVPSEIKQSAQGTAQGENSEDSSSLIGPGSWNPSSRPSEGLLKASPVGESLMEDMTVDVWDEGHTNLGLSAYKGKTDQRPGFENIELFNSVDMVVVGKVEKGSAFESGENIDPLLEGSLGLRLLENNVEVDFEGSLFEMISEEMVLEGHGDAGQIQVVETSESRLEIQEEEISKEEFRQDMSSVYVSELQKEGSVPLPSEELAAPDGDGWFWDLSQGEEFLKVQSMLQEVLDSQNQADGCEHFKDKCTSKNKLVQDVKQLEDDQHIGEFESVPVRTCIKSDDADGVTDGPDADDAKEGDKELVSMAADLQGIHKGNSIDKEVEGTSTLLNDCVSETAGQCVGDFISKSVTRGAVNQHVMEDEGCLVRDLVASSVDSSGEVDIQQASVRRVKAVCLEGEREKKCLEGDDAPCERNEKLIDLEVEELVVKDTCKGTEGDVLDDINATERQEEDLVLLVSANDIVENTHVRELEREAQQQETMSEHVEGMVLTVPPLKAEQEEEETALQEEDQEEGLDAVKEALQAERTILAALEAELENERNAAAIATSEAMAMISRLQEEKSAMQMEVAQLQRMSEEKADYDEQAMALLKEILFKREKEKFALEKEVELYKERLLAEKVDKVKRSRSRKENGGLSMQSPKPMLLLGGIDEDEGFLSPEGGNDQPKAVLSSEEVYQPGTKSAPSVLSTVPNMALEEGASTTEQKVSKRLRDSPLNDNTGAGLPPKMEDEWKLGDPLDGGLHGLHDIHQETREMGRSIFSTDDEETQFILERLWVLEEELQELRGKDELGTQRHCSKSPEVQYLDYSPMNRKAESSNADPWGVQCMDGDKSRRQRDEIEMDGAAGGFLPVHDVYEVHATPNHGPQDIEESDTSGDFECMLGKFESTPGNISQEYMAARMHRHMPLVPPRLPQARRLFPSKEMQSDSPTFSSQTTGWIVEDSPSAEDTWEHHDLQSQSLVSREGKLVEMEEIQQLAVRLEALEADRELLRETLESFKHRDAELNLLQEIAQHLRELRMTGFKRVSAGGLPRDSSAPSPGKSYARALKKRRYCCGPGQTQMLLLQQKSI